MKNNVVLIGMPACGKSTVGVILAKVMKYDFLDTDLLLQTVAGRSLTEIIDEDGIGGFLHFEEEQVAALRAEKTVIATGGSVIYGPKAMEALAKQGTIVYLLHRFEVIESRLTNIRNRGVVMPGGQTLRDLFNERTPLYERYADLILDADGLTVEQTAEAIAEKIHAL